MSSDYITEIVDKTPALANGTSRTFRDLQDQGYSLSEWRNQSELTYTFIWNLAGIISYTEYLFLLSILISESK